MVESFRCFTGKPLIDGRVKVPEKVAQHGFVDENGVHRGQAAVFVAQNSYP